MIAYFDNILEIINKSVHSLKEEQFLQLLDECVETLANGHKIIASGLGKNVPICEKFVGTMLSMGQSATFLHTNSAVHGDMGAVQDGDLVIILTKSGETQESVYLSRLLKERDCKLWLFSFEEDSTLAREMDRKLILQLEHEGDEWDIVPNNSTTINLIILQGLAMQITKKRNVTLAQFKRNHPGGHIGEVLK